MAGAQRFLIAIDLGTSGPKVALATATGAIVAHEVGKNQTHFSPDGGAEQDPDEWWSSIAECIRRLLARGIATSDDVVAICCSTHWSGTVAVGRDGRPLCPAHIWMDTRGSKLVRELSGGPIRISGYGVGKVLKWVRLTGGAPAHSGKDSLAHILYLKHARPEIYAAAQLLLEPKDYLNYRMTGRAAASYDSIILHWLTDNRDPNNVRYHPDLLRLTGVDRNKLPELRPATSILGTLTPQAAAELGLSTAVQVVTGTPDVQAAAIGSGAVRDFEPHLCVGTSSWISCHVPYKKTDLFNNLASLPSPIPGRYFVANDQETAGICLTFLRDNVLWHRDAVSDAAPPADVLQKFDQAAAEVPAGSEKLIFTPWLFGERTPIEDATVRGGFHNLSMHHDRRHLVRAVLEGVAFNARWLLGAVEKFVDRRLDHIRFIGGGAQSELWCQIFADVLDRTIEQVRDPLQSNVRGAALLGAAALGNIRFDQIAEQVPLARSFAPDGRTRAIYDELFGAFVDIYRRNKTLYARLNAAH